ncbi:hypothetical protein VP01_569g2 [Puccinia sorghi]|uniref:Uncharacterized protein n=1 Tax=Puccinia sorghi TaxID=27349 RepID=A0A0L6UIN6_9BASI|nr:hypothetical protein VP01_569g2 [Puccinia sorghi]
MFLDKLVHARNMTGLKQFLKQVLYLALKCSSKVPLPCRFEKFYTYIPASLKYSWMFHLRGICKMHVWISAEKKSVQKSWVIGKSNMIRKQVNFCWNISLGPIYLNLETNFQSTMNTAYVFFFFFCEKKKKKYPCLWVKLIKKKKKNSDSNYFIFCVFKYIYIYILNKISQDKNQRDLMMRINFKNKLIHQIIFLLFFFFLSSKHSKYFLKLRGMVTFFTRHFHSQSLSLLSPQPHLTAFPAHDNHLFYLAFIFFFLNFLLASNNVTLYFFSKYIRVETVVIFSFFFFSFFLWMFSSSIYITLIVCGCILFVFLRGVDVADYYSALAIPGFSTIQPNWVTKMTINNRYVRTTK